MSAVLGVAIIFAVIFGIYAIAYYTAPIGWEDDEGFHYGTPPEMRR